MGILSFIGTTARAVGFSVRVVTNVASSTLNGAAEVLNTTAQALDTVNRRDWDGLERLAEHKFNQLGQAIEAKFQAADDLLAEADACVNDPHRRFFTKENAARTAAVMTTAAGVVAGVALLETEDVEAAPVPDELNDAGFAVSDLSIDNGVFIGNESELQRLIAYGELEGTEHLNEEDIQRDPAARDAFLNAHGLAQVPEGMEVHHVVPLSEGGADTPSNMILVTEAEHDVITAAHARYYGW